MPICPLFSLPSREDTGKNRIEASQIEKKRLYIITLRLNSDVPVTPWQGNFDKVLTAEPGRADRPKNCAKRGVTSSCHSDAGGPRYRDPAGLRALRSSLDWSAA